MRIVFFLACWKRPEITELCFMGLKRLMEYKPEKFQSTAFAVISEPSMVPLCVKYGIDYIMHDNEPVGRKKNAGLTALLSPSVTLSLSKGDFDYLIELGSDDLILNSLLDAYLPLMEAGIDFFGCKQLLMVDSTSGNTRNFFFDPDLVQGLGRCMSRKMLEQFTGKVRVKANTAIMSQEAQISEGEEGYLDKENYEIFSKLGWVDPVTLSLSKGQEACGEVHLWDDINRGLDNNSTARIQRAGYKFHLVETPEPLMTDFKSDENIWGYNPEIGEPYDLEKFMKQVSQKERGHFFNLMKKLKARRIETAAA